MFSRGKNIHFSVGKQNARPGMVIHTCNLSYSGGRDQEDYDLRLAKAES
jgi:hypothetical protein